MHHQALLQCGGDRRETRESRDLPVLRVGLAAPSSLHRGPGRAGGGAELGGLRALDLYSQRIALQGAKRTVEGFVRS